MTTEKKTRSEILLNKFEGTWSKTFGYVLFTQLLSRVARVVKADRDSNIVYPEVGTDTMFKAFEVTPLDAVRVVILGQDPYHNGSFNGLAFGNGTIENPTTSISPSLRNIIREAENSYSGKVEPSLYSWAKQGVLLINTAHTVREKDPGSHLDVWKEFTQLIIDSLNTQPNIIWMLWGAKAQEYANSIYNDTHAVIETGHPSPLNRNKPFYGSGCFIECDRISKEMGLDTIKWTTE